MKALSIRPPWWLCILYLGKDIENRNWKTNYRGPLLIHASMFWQRDAINDDSRAALAMSKDVVSEYRQHLDVKHRDSMKRLGGRIIGQVDLVDVVESSTSPWFVGRYGFVLQNPRVLKAYPVKGSLGLFEAPEPEA